MKSVTLSAGAIKQLRKLGASVSDRILDKLDAYAAGESADVTTLKGHTGELRLRVGDWRVVFEETNGVASAIAATFTIRNRGACPMTKARIFKTPGGEELAIMPRAEYEALLGELEDLADHAAIEESRRAVAEGRDLVLPRDVGYAIARGENQVKALRNWRGLTQAELAAAAGITPTYLSHVENGKAPGNKARKALAAALKVPEMLLLDD